MRSIVIASLVLAAAMSARTVSAQESQKSDPNSIEHQIALEVKKFQLEQMHAEADFKYQMRQMEIEGKKLEIEARRRQIHGDSGGGGLVVLLLLACMVVHILATVWVYVDIRQRNTGSGLWVALTLFTGLFGALVYVVSRIGDSKAADKQ